jgi:glycosyltransferase involved in cell wall biosynthesis
MNAATTVADTPPRRDGMPMAGRSSTKKILIVCGFRIFPCNTGGHVRTGSIARSLARMGHQVLIYSLAGRKGDYRLPEMLWRSHRIDVIAPNLSEETNLGLGFGLAQGIGRRLDYPRFWQHALLKRGIVPRRLKAALRTADIVLSDMPWCPPIPGARSGVPNYLVSHNLEHRLLAQGNARHRRFADWMQRIEADAPNQYSDIFACAEEDREFFRLHDTAGRLGVPFIRCAVDPDDYAVPEGTRERVRAELGIADRENLLVFSGSGFGPNVEALAVLRDFCHAELDFLNAQRLRILVLGSVASAPFREGALIATGRVPEVAPYLAASDAGLNPITRGSGANVKLFEYLAARLPVISTIFGVRGTELEANVDFLPYEPRHPTSALERFGSERSREQWRAHAEAVWIRHRGSCDINELVREAIASLPGFAA